MKIRNPRTGLYDYEIVIPSEEAVMAMSTQLRAGQLHWFAAGIDARISAMQQWKAAIIAHKQVLTNALCADTGRQRESLLEVELVAASVDRWCTIAKNAFAQPERKTSSIPFLQMQQDWVPYQLVGVISPWNFPLLLSLIDTIPALLSGCAVAVKPSEVTPRFIEVMQRTIGAVPALQKVFAYLAGDGTTGAALVNHCDLVCFTGSTATGKKVYDAASKKMIPVFLELGGKDPAIVLQGADIDRASASILWGSTANAGQSCLSIERVYVQDTVYDEFTAQLIKKASQLELNADSVDRGQIGPVIFEKQAAIINAHLQDALEKGARIVYGDAQCQLINGGYYCKPTILVNVNHSMRVMQEETFGPVIPLMAFATVEEAVALANDTQYGLSGAVFAATTEAAMAVGARITGGAISINDCALTAVLHEGEKQSFKLSGIGGTRMGPSAIKRFMRQKVFLINEGKENDPWWYGGG
jgi:succinate-semialdehyde dehydrogenase / glutarate-semialdehyde dehydrogenase